MDTGKGYFVKFDKDDAAPDGFGRTKERLSKLYPGHGGIFKEGEKVELKGSRFEISKILQNGLKLKLLEK